MAERHRRAHRSLRSRLLVAVLLPLAATWSIGSAVAFSLSWVLAGRAFDRALLDDAYVIAASVVERDGALQLALTAHEVGTVLFDREDREYFAVVDDAGRVVASNVELAALGDPAHAAGIFHDAVLDGDTVRVAALRGQGERPFAVYVAQTTHARKTLLLGLLERSLVPQVALLLLLGWVLWRQISRELKPLGELQRALDRRHSSDLDPIAGEPVSSDVEKLRDAVNALLARVGLGVQAQREFAGNVAHDLRTPLAGIRALAEYGLAQNDPQTWRRQLERIVASEERASRLVDQLLALALADEARDSVRLAPVRVDELVRDIVVSFVGRADAAEVDLEAEGLDAPVVAMASPTLLEGVLTNLIDNALRYGAGGSPATLTITVEHRDRRVRIAVTDTGPGIEPQQRARIVERWAQGSAGVQLGAGVGLGLAIASRCAAVMRGSLTLEAGPHGRGLSAVLELGDADGSGGVVPEAQTTPTSAATEASGSRTPADSFRS
ncbi:MAG TPA: sensor histidine kinase [Caldimonas sp.]|nr:sensor histidine kinase [Caldimonas sp.]